MFGTTEADLARARRPPPRVRAWVALLLWAPCVVVFALATVLDVLSYPEKLQAVMDHFQARGQGRATLVDFEVLPVGELGDWSTWRFVVSGLAFRPHDPLKPDWRADRALLDLPRLVRTTEGWVLAFDVLRVGGLAIRAHQQRPPPPWTPRRDLFLRAITVKEVEIHDASFEAPPDEPIGQAVVRGIRGSLRDLVWSPGVREVSASGTAHVDSFTTGSITVTDVDLTTFDFERSNMRFGGTFLLGATPGRLTGTIETFHVKSAVTLDVRIAGARLGEVVEMATGTRGPVEGALDLSLRVRAGGELPRGGSILEGNLRLVDGRIQLGRDTRYLYLDLLQILPWVRLNASNQVELDEMRGAVRFTRGQVQLRELTYPAGKRQLRVDGTIEQDLLHLLVRLLPPEHRSDRPGLGIVLYGSPRQQQFRLAQREDMVREAPWEPVYELATELPVVKPRKVRPSRGGEDATDPPPSP